MSLVGGVGQCSVLRNKETHCQEFRRCTNILASLLCVEATQDLTLENREIETPLCTCLAPHLSSKVCLPCFGCSWACMYMIMCSYNLGACAFVANRLAYV